MELEQQPLVSRWYTITEFLDPCPNGKPLVIAIGGSWLTDRKLAAAGRWDEITALGLGVSLLLGGCGKKTDTVKIGFVVKQPEVAWFQLEWQFADRAASDLGFTLIKIGASDGEKVLSAIDNLAASGAQGVIICTPDTRTIGVLITRDNFRQILKEQGIRE